ncbi:hypothetical protein H2203_007727 [Taxawa tesnikishii (nom. ined.)]|nr:hypothetical protein H2203_007727 [Dothideales sp. JES 119]
MAPRIPIIGAGLGGLTFAQGLNKAGIDFHILERSDNYRPQGYCIRLHSGGLTASRSPDQLTMYGRSSKQTCAETRLGPPLFISPDTGEADTSHPFKTPLRPIRERMGKPYTPDRTVLREVLLTGIRDRISYGTEFTHYSLGEDSVTAHDKR